MPKAILDSAQNILGLVGSIVLAAVVNPYFLIPVLVLSVFFQLSRVVYLKTSRNVRRLEATGKKKLNISPISCVINFSSNSTAKSPAFTHLSATLTGLSTVRAFKAEEILRKEFDDHQDLHSGCWFMAISTVATFNIALDFICLVFISCIILYYMILDTTATAAKVGLAVSQAINLTGMVGWGE